MPKTSENLADDRIQADRLHGGRGSESSISLLPTNSKHRKRNKELERARQLPLLPAPTMKQANRLEKD